MSSRQITKRTKLALWLMIGPTLLFVASLFVFTGLSWISQTRNPAPPNDCAVSQTAQNAPNECALFGTISPIDSIASIGLFVVGVLVFLTWLPGMIIGIILLATKPRPILQ